MNPQPLPPLHPKVVLGIAAHPDDLDFGAAATMATYASMGADIYYLILTDGSKGSEDRSLTSEQLVKIRENEQQEALEVLGGKSVEFLGYPDGGLEITMELKKDIVRHIRMIKPDVVVTMDPSVIYSEYRNIINHPDHRAAGQAALDAVFPLARDHLTFPDLLDEGFQPHKTPTVLLINFEKSNYGVDVTEDFNKKISALGAHASQIDDMKKVESWITQIAIETGKQFGYEKAESFVRLDIS